MSQNPVLFGIPLRRKTSQHLSVSTMLSGWCWHGLTPTLTFLWVYSSWCPSSPFSESIHPSDLRSQPSLQFCVFMGSLDIHWFLPLATPFQMSWDHVHLSSQMCYFLLLSFHPCRLDLLNSFMALPSLSPLCLIGMYNLKVYNVSCTQGPIQGLTESKMRD